MFIFLTLLFFWGNLDTSDSYGIIQDMPEDISKENLKLFSLIMQNLGTIIKNSVLYPVSHPISELSIKNFKVSIDKWFSANETLNIGISPDSVLLDGNFIDKKNVLYREVGSHLHAHGISAIFFRKGLDINELMGMFKFLKDEAKLMREGNSAALKIPEFEHITIKSVDYSLLLEGEGGHLSEGDEGLWRMLTDVSSESRRGKLPEEREEFIRNFLKDSKRSAMVLNKIYKDAVLKLEGDDAVSKTRESFARIYDYVSKNPEGVGDSARTDIGKIVSRLDPDFVVRLFSPGIVDGRDFDFTREMMKDVPDEFVAGFIESLVRSSGGFNENLLKVFERISPGGAREGKIASIVAERLSEASAITRESLTEMQMSIKEVFASNPGSGFMSQMYNLTVDTFIDRKAAKMNLPKDLVAMVESYNKELEDGGFKGQETELILNLMWYETDAAAFERLSARLKKTIPGLLISRDISSIKDIISLFFVEEIGNKRKISGAEHNIKNFKDDLKKESFIREITTLLAGSDEKKAVEAAFILKKLSSPGMVNAVLDEFCREEKEGRRNNLFLVLGNLSYEEMDILAERIKMSDSRSARELFSLFKKKVPDKAKKLALELLNSNDISVKTDILDDLIPETEEERSSIKNILKHETDPVLRRKAIMSLFKTKERADVEDLFLFAAQTGGNNELLMEVIEIAGEMGSRESVNSLGAILGLRDIFNRNEKIKFSAVVALGRIRNEEAIGAVKKAYGKCSGKVRDICDVVLKLENVPKKNVN